MTELNSPELSYIISVNYRETKVYVQQDKKNIWDSTIYVGGVDWSFELTKYLQVNNHLLIGRRTAEVVILNIGSVILLPTPLRMVIRGLNLETNLPYQMEITSEQVHHIVEPSLKNIAHNISIMFRGLGLDDKTEMNFPQLIPIELRRFISEKPILLTGEFGNLHGLDQLFESILHIPVVKEI